MEHFTAEEFYRFVTNDKYTMDTKVVAIITARGGSKGLPRKNILELNGKPLIAHTIEAAIQSCVFESVYVSTEDSEIKTVAMQYGADVIDRPLELATDDASSLAVISHALNHLSKKGLSFTHFILLQPTSPLRDADHVLHAWKRYLQNNGEGSLVSVTIEKDTPFKQLVLNENGEAVPLFQWEDLVKPRQALPTTYKINGAIYISQVDNFLKTENIFSKPLSLFEMDENSSIDIDSIEDFERASKELQKINA